MKNIITYQTKLNELYNLSFNGSDFLDSLIPLPPFARQYMPCQMVLVFWLKRSDVLPPIRISHPKLHLSAVM